jgi:hypothetical protein
LRTRESNVNHLPYLCAPDRFEQPHRLIDRIGNMNPSAGCVKVLFKE